MKLIDNKIFDEVLNALKDEAAYYEAEWKAVGNHPSSRFKKEMEYFQNLVKRLEDNASNK